jgi:glycosyltransferase involved in cell wall biosynthesis
LILKKAKIVVAVSTYNQADFLLPLCLESIQNQTFKDFVCIVGDDHSTDNTKEVVERFAKKDKRFVYHLTLKKYVLNSYFYNWVAQNYNCEYLATCDGDNFFLPRHLQVLYNKFSQGDYIAVYAWANNLVWKDDRRTKDYQYFRGQPWDLNSYIYNTSYCNFIDMSDILFKRKYYLKAGGYLTTPDSKDCPSYQDYSIMIRLAIKFDNKIGYCPEVLTFYSVFEDSQCRTRDATLERHKNIFEV